MKKILFSCLLLASCSTPSFDNVNGFPEEILPSDIYNTVQKEYAEIGIFEKGISIVTKDGFYGLLKCDGKIALNCEFDTIFQLNNDYRIIKKGELYGITDKSGAICFECQYDRIKGPYNQNYIAVCRNNKWGFVNEKNETKIQFKFDEIYQANDSLFVASLHGKYGMSTFDEQNLIDYKYDRVIYRPFKDSCNISWVMLNDKYGVVNSENKLITEIEYDNYYASSSEGYLCLKRNSLEGAINPKTGEIVIPFEYWDLDDCSEGLFCAKKIDKGHPCGYLYPGGEIAIPFKYEEGFDFKNGLACVGINKRNILTDYGYMPDVYFGVINRQGDWVIKPSFKAPFFSSDMEAEFSEGLIAMGKDDTRHFHAQKIGYINMDGEWIIEPAYTNAKKFHFGTAIVGIDKSFGMIDKTGKVIIPLEYEQPYGDRTDSLVFLEKDGKRYTFNLEGKILEME